MSRYDATAAVVVAGLMYVLGAVFGYRMRPFVDRWFKKLTAALSRQEGTST